VVVPQKATAFLVYADMTGITLGQQHLNTANTNQSMIHDDINYEHILSQAKLSLG